MYRDTIKEICKEKGFTVAQVEREAGMAPGTIKNWNRFAPSLTNLVSVSNVLGVSLDYIVQRDQERAG